jgi:hypothetical protein
MQTLLCEFQLLSLVLLHAWKGQFWCLQVEISCCGQSVNPVQPVRNLVERWLRVGPARPLQTVIGSSGGDYVMVISYGRPRQSWMYHCQGGDTRSCEEVIGDKRHSLSRRRVIKQCGRLLCNLQPALLYHIRVLIDTVRWCFVLCEFVLFFRCFHTDEVKLMKGSVIFLVIPLSVSLTNNGEQSLILLIAMDRDVSFMSECHWIRFF